MDKTEIIAEDYKGMKFVEGFSWAIPFAFIETVANCSFCQGDILYDTPKGYLQWDEAIKHLKYSIQVISPQEKFLSSDFKTNWVKGVQLALYDWQNKGSKTYIDITQGRLFTLLWKGDLNILLKKDDDIPIPLLLPDTYKQRVQKLKTGSLW